MPFNTPTMTIPLAAWEPTGSDDKPRSRLLAHVLINGQSFHCEAYQVTSRRRNYRGLDNQVPVDSTFDECFAGLFTIDEGAKQTQRIKGRDYVIVIYPHQE